MRDGSLGGVSQPCPGEPCAHAGEIAGVASMMATARTGNRGFMPKSLFLGGGAASRKSVQSRANNAAEMGSRPNLECCRIRLALAGLEAAMRLVDDIDAPLAPHDAIVAMAAAQRF